MVRHSPRFAARAFALAFAVALPATSPAQQQAPPTPGSAVSTTVSKPTAAASAVSLERIRRQLRETAPTRDATGASSLLKLEYYVQVVGTPPPIDFLKDFHVGRGPNVQYGGMTHDEFLRVTGPFWRKTW